MIIWIYQEKENNSSKENNHTNPEQDKKTYTYDKWSKQNSIVAYISFSSLGYKLSGSPFYILCMEKLYKLRFRPSCEPTTTAITNFNTPLHSTLCSSRERLHVPGPLSTRFLHHRSATSTNITQNDFLKVKPEPLRSN